MVDEKKSDNDNNDPIKADKGDRETFSRKIADLLKNLGPVLPVEQAKALLGIITTIYDSPREAFIGMIAVLEIVQATMRIDKAKYDETLNAAFGEAATVKRQLVENMIKPESHIGHGCDLDPTADKSKAPRFHVGTDGTATDSNNDNRGLSDTELAQLRAALNNPASKVTH